MIIEIGISRHKGFEPIGLLIKWYLGIDFSHIFFIVNNETIYHANIKGFHKDTIEEFEKKNLIVGRKKAPVLNFDLAVGYLEGNIGKDYGQTQYLGFLFPWLQRLVDNNKERTICSEIVADFAEICCGIELKEDSDFTDPKEAWDLF